MSEIKLKEESMEDTLKNKVSGARLDFDENNNPFYRLTMYLKEPHTNIEYYMELNKNDSKELIIQKEDGNYVEKILKNAPDSKEGFFTTIKVIE